MASNVCRSIGGKSCERTGRQGQPDVSADWNRPRAFCRHSGCVRHVRGNNKQASAALARLEIWPFQFSDEANAALAKLAAIDPAALDWERMERILSYAGTWLRWPCVFILAVLALWSSITGSVDKLKRKFNMESLLANNVKNFPCLAPIVGKGKYLISNASYDKGLWEIARSPVQFALENEIMTYANGTACPLGDALHNGLPSIEAKAFGQCAFVESQAKNVLRHQLGERFTSFLNLSPVRKAIVYAFVQYALGNKKQRVLLNR